MQSKWRFIGQMMLVFIGAMLFFHFIRYFDLGEQKTFVLNSPGGRIAFLVILGGIGGFAFAMIELALDRPSLKRLSYGRLLVFKAILYFFLIKLIMWIGLIILTRRSPLDLDWNWMIEIMNSRAFWVALAYFSVVIFLITFFRAVDQKFGPGVLWNMLLGKYHQPQEEQRIFMFLDLKSSTTIAEELGHLRFSRFIQDCFYDLNEIVPQFKAEIYQYVGDEAVLKCSKLQSQSAPLLIPRHLQRVAFFFSETLVHYSHRPSHLPPSLWHAHRSKQFEYASATESIVCILDRLLV